MERRIEQHMDHAIQSLATLEEYKERNRHAFTTLKEKAGYSDAMFDKMREVHYEAHTKHPHRRAVMATHLPIIIPGDGWCLLYALMCSVLCMNPCVPNRKHAVPAEGLDNFNEWRNRICEMVKLADRASAFALIKNSGIDELVEDLHLILTGSWCQTLSVEIGRILYQYLSFGDGKLVLLSSDEIIRPYDAVLYHSGAHFTAWLPIEHLERLDDRGYHRPLCLYLRMLCQTLIGTLAHEGYPMRARFEILCVPDCPISPKLREYYTEFAGYVFQRSNPAVRVQMRELISLIFKECTGESKKLSVHQHLTDSLCGDLYRDIMEITHILVDRDRLATGKVNTQLVQEIKQLDTVLIEQMNLIVAQIFGIMEF